MLIQHKHNRRKGAIVVLAAVFMLLMFAFLAFAVDLGYLSVARTQMQRSADAAAIAATWKLLDDESVNSPNAISDARATAADYAGRNKILSNSPNLAESDVTVSYLSNPFDPRVQFDLSGLRGYNAVQVRVQRTAAQNGTIPLFFARVLGISQQGAQAVATAAFLSNISGFKSPADGSNLAVLPFALDEGTWNELTANQGTDTWSYDPDTKQVSKKPDEIKETNLFPQGTGSPGNRGTVDIGNPNNSTADLKRQITDGATAEDLSYLGGRLALNESGTLSLNGDTGISAGVKDALTGIIGQPRIIPIFRSVSGQGNNAQYVIVGFAGVRIMEVQLTGSMNNKRVIIQPAKVFVKGVVPSIGVQTSTTIYTPVTLVR